MKLPEWYAVTATRHGRQVETFYLRGDVQGIIHTEHAESIARSILGGGDGLSVCAVETSFDELAGTERRTDR